MNARDDRLAWSTLVAALAQIVPVLGPIEPLTMLGEGFGSVIVQTASDVVIRIAKTAAAGAGHAREARVLPRLRPWLPYPIPVPRWYTGPQPGLPFGAIAYEGLDGQPLAPGLLTEATGPSLAAELAIFLAALQQVPLWAVAGCQLPDPAMQQAALHDQRAVVVSALVDCLPAGDYGKVVVWWQHFLADPQLAVYRPTLRHGDLWWANILVDPTASWLSGILDWEATAIGDPAQDLAALLQLGPDLVALVLKLLPATGIPVDACLRYRIGRWWEQRVFDGLQEAIQQGDQAALQNALENLHASPILYGAPVELS